MAGHQPLIGGRDGIDSGTKAILRFHPLVVRFAPRRLSLHTLWRKASPLAGHPLSRAYSHYLAATFDADRYRSFDRRSEHLRSIREPLAWRASRPARTVAALARIVRRERHAMTSYPCRLENGQIGRTVIVEVDGEWTAVCTVA